MTSCDCTASIHLIEIDSFRLILERLYTQKHEWVLVDGETGTVGISNYAQVNVGCFRAIIDRLCMLMMINENAPVVNIVTEIGVIVSSHLPILSNM